jgi:hypothetical protein
VRQAGHTRGIEESFKLKRTLLLSMLAVVPAVLMPLAATSQSDTARRSRSADETVEPSKYEVYAGYGYTNLNQVNQSRSGLHGAEFTVTRDWGKYFGLTADGAVYQWATANPEVENTTYKPTVDAVLFGPVFHANLYGRTDGFVRVLLGGEHTAGTNQTPNISFAGGFGGGLDYRFSKHFSLRASGDEIESSFSVTGNSSALAYSPHAHRNVRASFGVVYKF